MSPLRINVFLEEVEKVTNIKNIKTLNQLEKLKVKRNPSSQIFQQCFAGREDSPELKVKTGPSHVVVFLEKV